jgi:hypothetical protein
MNQLIRSGSNPFSRSLLTAMGLIGLALASAQAVTPAPDGGYANQNTAEGTSALFSLTTGVGNTALGFQALYVDNIQSYNTAVGVRALRSNGTDGNTAVGWQALYKNSLGGGNTAVGYSALELNSMGGGNTAVGYQALSSSNGADGINTAVGYKALMTNTVGYENTAVGNSALVDNTVGTDNTAMGQGALVANDTGSFNCAFGDEALLHNVSGSANVAIGPAAGDKITTASGIIAISNSAADVSNTCWISNIYGVTTQSATTLPVIVSNTGQLGTAASSARFKKDIKPMEKASDAILALKPVTFHYKKDNTSTPQFGLVAEDVAKVDPDLVVRDDKGEIYTVRYDAVNVMLLNEFLKEHQQVQQQQKEIEALRSELKEQRTLIRKVSTQLEAKQSTPQLAANP